MVYEHIYREPLPTDTLLFDGSTYDLEWDGSRNTPPETPVMPTIDHAIYLINSVKFHCGQLFHLFDEEDFMRSLYDFYSEPKGQTLKNSLWYIHFLVILAFGKAFVLRKNERRRPSGAEFFVLALQLLPDIRILSRDPIMSTEILCCIALYLQSLDFRSTAHNYVRSLDLTLKLRLTYLDWSSNAYGLGLWNAYRHANSIPGRGSRSEV